MKLQLLQQMAWAEERMIQQQKVEYGRRQLDPTATGMPRIK
jgi:hypothetical protein